jgi:hypothetical protein
MPPNKLRVAKSRMLRWAAHIARISETAEFWSGYSFQETTFKADMQMRG